MYVKFRTCVRKLLLKHKYTHRKSYFYSDITIVWDIFVNFEQNLQNIFLSESFCSNLFVKFTGKIVDGAGTLYLINENR
jgi:hypothetical protein